MWRKGSKTDCSGVEEKQAAPELALPKQGIVSWETRQELV